MRHFIARFFIWFVLLSSIASLVLARSLNWDMSIVALTASLLTLLCAWGLEHIMPFCQQWNQANDDVATDASSALVIVGLVDPLLKYFAPIGVVAMYAFITTPPLWTTLNHQPFALQVLMATLFIELGRYWSHRWHHTNAALWWLHALHHSSERLYTLNNFRFHPLNYMINFSLSTLPLMLLGAPADVLLAYLILTQPILMVQHANVDFKNGDLNYILSTNENHRWHHSASPSEANSNYGNALMIWDWIFGTFKYAPTQTPKRIGLFTQSNAYPARAGYLSQLLSMWRPKCCR